MALQLNRLGAKTVTAAKSAGLLADGGGLYLRVTVHTGKDDKPRVSKSWVFIYKRAGKRTELGLGSLTAVTLADARTKAGEARASSRRAQSEGSAQG